MKKFMINPKNYFVSIATAVFCLVIAIAMATIREYIGLLVFLLIAFVFIIVSNYSGSHLLIDKSVVKRKSLFGKVKEFKMEEIKEIGVAGSKVINNGGGKKTGTVYIYFSKEELSDQDLFDMMLRWPPRDKLYMEYTAERARYVMSLWAGEIKKYNFGKKEVGVD